MFWVVWVEVVVVVGFEFEFEIELELEMLTGSGAGRDEEGRGGGDDAGGLSEEGTFARSFRMRLLGFSLKSVSEGIGLLWSRRGVMKVEVFGRNRHRRNTTAFIFLF